VRAHRLTCGASHQPAHATTSPLCTHKLRVCDSAVGPLYPTPSQTQDCGCIGLPPCVCVPLCESVLCAPPFAPPCARLAVWVYCGNKTLCGAHHKECWLKHLAHPYGTAPAKEGPEVGWTTGILTPQDDSAAGGEGVCSRRPLPLAAAVWAAGSGCRLCCCWPAAAFVAAWLAWLLAPDAGRVWLAAQSRGCRLLLRGTAWVGWIHEAWEVVAAGCSRAAAHLLLPTELRAECRTCSAQRRWPGWSAMVGICAWSCMNHGFPGWLPA
jgi:hypothetical protein